MTGPLVSVVVTAHDAARTIGSCLEAIVSQERPASLGVEVILVDDRSGDATGEIGRAISGVRVVRIDSYERGPLTARQVAIDRGVHAARGEIIVLTDADARPSRDWVARIVAPLVEGRADIVAGGVAFGDASAAGLIAALQSADAAFYLGACALLGAVGIPGGLLFGGAAFNRRAYDALGGFTGIGPALTEDLAFARAAHRVGLRLVFVWRPPVVVAPCTGWRQLARRAHRTSAGGASALAMVLGVWMFSLAALSVTTVIGLTPVSWLLTRWFVGAGFTVAALAREGRISNGWIAPLYESAAVALGVRVLWELRMVSTVEWGGVTYRRAAPGQSVHAS